MKNQTDNATAIRITPEAPSPAALKLLREHCPTGDVRALVRSYTTIDVGLWFRWRRIWVCGTDDRLIFLAEGPRPYVQTAMYSAMTTSFYSHPSGELVCVRAPELIVHSLAMGPAAAWRLLGLIHGARRGAIITAPSAALSA